MKKLICVLALLFSTAAHAEFVFILTSCEFTSNTSEQKALQYVQIRRTYLASVGSDAPQDQITYQGYIFQHGDGTNPDVRVSGEDVVRTPGVPATPKKVVRFQDGTQFDLTIDPKTLEGTFAYKNSADTQPVKCSASADGKYW
jgi:hypothetical protein